MFKRRKLFIHPLLQIFRIFFRWIKRTFSRACLSCFVYLNDEVRFPLFHYFLVLLGPLLRSGVFHFRFIYRLHFHVT